VVQRTVVAKEQGNPRQSTHSRENLRNGSNLPLGPEKLWATEERHKGKKGERKEKKKKKKWGRVGAISGD